MHENYELVGFAFTGSRSFTCSGTSTIVTTIDSSFVSLLDLFMFFSSLYLLLQVVFLKLDGRFLQLGHAAKSVGGPMVLVSALSKKKIGQRRKNAVPAGQVKMGGPLHFKSRYTTLHFFKTIAVVIML